MWQKLLEPEEALPSIWGWGCQILLWAGRGVVAGNQVPLICNLAALCLETCRWSRCVASQEMLHFPSRWEMTPVKNSATGLITESPCKAKLWVSSKWRKGSAVAFGFPLGLWGLGSQMHQIPQCPPLQHPRRPAQPPAEPLSRGRWPPGHLPTPGSPR